MKTINTEKYIISNENLTLEDRHVNKTEPNKIKYTLVIFPGEEKIIIIIFLSKQHIFNYKNEQNREWDVCASSL